MVVAIDFSESSERTAGLAALWTLDAEIHFVHAVDGDLEPAKRDADFQNRIANARANSKLLRKGAAVALKMAPTFRS